DGKSNRRRVDARAHVEAPKLLQGFGIERVEAAVHGAVEYDVAGGRERSAIVRILNLELRLGLAGQRIDRLHGAVALLGKLAGRAAGKALTRLHRAALIDEVFLLDRRDRITAFDGGQVEQVKVRIVRRGRPVLAAAVGGAGGRRSLAAQTVAARRIDL